MTVRIGVTTSLRGGWRSLLMNRIALWRAGAKAIRLVAERSTSLEGLDALIVGGGDDIGAELYGGVPTPDIRIDPARDALELKLLKKALAQRMPILGICRGAQILNVKLGGTLYPEIYQVYENAPRVRTVLPRKTVTLDEHSHLARVLQCNPCRVNALHHQAIDALGEGLRVIGRDEVGIVQAVETTGDDFVIGVQWHPELLIFSSAQLRLFRALAVAAHAWQRTGYGSIRATDRIAAEESAP